MLSALKFVQGAVAKKDFVPSLTHFKIEAGLVKGYNGMIGLCSPIPLDIECAPKAEPLIRAIGNCEDTVQMSMTPAGRLSIKSGVFKAFVDCVPGETAHVEPEGDFFDIDGEGLLRAVKSIQEFIGDDASRPWSNGVLFRGQSAFATNNVCLVEYWVGSTFPIEAGIPRLAIKEMIRINEAPVRAQISANSITLHYSGDRWLRSQLLNTDWPDLHKVLDKPSNPVPMDPRLFLALPKLKNFCDKNGRIIIKDGIVSTHLDPTEGANYEIPDLQWEGVYNIDMLQSLEGVALQIDWSAYPSPCLFFGEGVRGAIIGMRI